MLYAVIAADTVPERFDLSGIGKLQPYKIKTDLLPVLRHGEYFDLAAAREETTHYLTGLLRPEKDELLFWQAFAEKKYRPELLFAGEAEILTHLRAPDGAVEMRAQPRRKEKRAGALRNGGRT